MKYLSLLTMLICMPVNASIVKKSSIRKPSMATLCLLGGTGWYAKEYYQHLNKTSTYSAHINSDSHGHYQDLLKKECNEFSSTSLIFLLCTTPWLNIIPFGLLAVCGVRKLKDSAEDALFGKDAMRQRRKYIGRCDMPTKKEISPVIAGLTASVFFYKLLAKIA